MNWILAVFLFVPTQAFAAARTVNIAVDGTMKLTNPTAVAVSYTVSCKNKTGTQVLAPTTENLAAGASKMIGTASGTTACKSGLSLTPYPNGYTGGASTCHSMSGIPYTNASTWCETGYHVCTFADINVVRTSLSGPWGVTAIPTGTWSFRIYDMMTASYIWSDDSGGTYMPYLDSMGMTNNKCATGPGGTGTVIDACFSQPRIDPMTTNPMNVTGVSCCPDIIGITHCSVTINAATPAAGHLISPQFKGGSPF